MYKIIIWFRYNLRFLFIKILSVAIKAMPYKAFIAVLGALYGFLAMCLRFKQWKPIIGFAKQTNSALPGWLYVIRYFIQQGNDRVWTILYYEAPPQIKKYIVVENEEILKQALRKDRGVVLVGAHYGPSLTTFMLHRINVNAVMLVSFGFFKRLQEAGRLVIKSLISKRIQFYIDSRSTLVARRSEKEFVHHLKNGGVVSMHPELRQESREGMVTEFFGYPVRLSYFPFKLALNYKVPVFFFFFDKAKKGGYRLCLVPSGQFTTPYEGIQRYISFFQKQITTNPFMWKVVPKFMNYVRQP